MKEIIELLTSYAVIVPFSGFIFCCFVMIISTISIGIDNEIDLPGEVFGITNPMVTAGLSKIPLMIGLTLTFLPMTIINLMLEQYVYFIIKEIPVIGLNIYYVISTIGLFITFVISLFIAGYMAKPIEKAINNSKYSVTYEFKTGIVNSQNITKDYGEIKLLIDNGEHYVDSVIEDDQKIIYGDHVIIKRQREDGKYIVEKIIN